MRKVKLLPTRDCETGYGPSTDRNKQFMVVVTIILLSAYMLQLSQFHLYFFEVILEKYFNLCISCQLGIHVHPHHNNKVKYIGQMIVARILDSSDGKVHSFWSKNVLCQLLKPLKIIEVILPFIKKVL